MFTETWKTIDWLPGYEFSSLGQVRNSRTGRLLATTQRPRGYRSIMLQIEGAGRNFAVHRLVCEAFRGPCPDGKQCDHINRNTGDNREGNLRWVKPEFNRGRRQLARGSGHGRSKLTEDIVIRIREVAPSMTRREAGVLFGVDNSTVCDIVNRKIWRHI